MSYKYKPEFCQLLIEHMSKGLSFETFGAEINVVRSTLYKWCDDFPEFKDAKDIAFQKAQLFFEKRLVVKISGQKLDGINAKDIDGQCLMFGLKTRFHPTYGDRAPNDSNKNSFSLEYVKNNAS